MTGICGASISMSGIPSQSSIWRLGRRRKHLDVRATFIHDHKFGMTSAISQVCTRLSLLPVRSVSALIINPHYQHGKVKKSPAPGIQFLGYPRHINIKSSAWESEFARKPFLFCFECVRPRAYYIGRIWGWGRACTHVCACQMRSGASHKIAADDVMFSPYHRGYVDG